jgi:hypothetical protein
MLGLLVAVFVGCRLREDACRLSAVSHIAGWWGRETGSFRSVIMGLGVAGVASTNCLATSRQTLDVECFGIKTSRTDQPEKV